MQMLEQFKRWYSSPTPRDMLLVNITTAIVVITLFYLILWEPLHKGLQQEQTKSESQQQLLQWMQQSAMEVKHLTASGGHQIKLRNQPVSLVLEQSLKNAGLKPYVGKLESSGNNSARVKLDGVPFDQMLVWLDTIATYNAILVSSASVERGEKPGSANVRLSLSRP